MTNPERVDESSDPTLSGFRDFKMGFQTQGVTLG
jgi:hypothetical protein